jgi:hypothetical protein
MEQAERKFWIALVLYGVLAVLVWFTLGSGTILAFGQPVQLRWLPLLVIASFAARTLVARSANRIRAERQAPDAGGQEQ